MSILIIISSLVSLILSENATLSPTMEPTLSPTTNAIKDDTTIETSAFITATISTSDNITVTGIILEKGFEIDYADVVSFNENNPQRRRLLKNSINITYEAEFEFVVRENDDISDINKIQNNINNFIQNSNELKMEISNDIKQQIKNEYNVNVTDVAVQMITVDEVELIEKVRVPKKKKDATIWIVLVILVIIAIVVGITAKNVCCADDEQNKANDTNNEPNDGRTNTNIEMNKELNKVKSQDDDDDDDLL